MITIPCVSEYLSDFLNLNDIINEGTFKFKYDSACFVFILAILSFYVLR